MPRKPSKSASPAVEKLLTIREAAAVLKLAGKTVYAMVNAHELPAFKVRGQWRIRGVDFEKWMTEQTRAAMRQRGDE